MFNKNLKRNFRRAVIVVAALLMSVVIFLTGCSNQSSSKKTKTDSTAQSSKTNNTQSATTQSNSKVIKEGDSLVIPMNEVSTTARFYPVTVDGMSMEVIAVKAPDGTIRTAFNTCQVCYDSGRGYYKQSGGKLVCQNCGNQFTMNRVEVESGGCNPWPIFKENKTVTNDSISISYDFLKQAKQIFSNWKSNY